MKMFRIAAVLLVIVSLFTVVAAAAVYTPSIERKDGPELVEGNDDLIITPLKELADNPDELHEDIHKSLSEAWEELKQSTWQELVADFADHWEKWTGGAPLDHAVVSDIFDVRLASELNYGDIEGTEITFSFKLQGLTADDVFMIIAKSAGDEKWVVVDYVISEDGVVTITHTSKTVFAIVRDNGKVPEVNPDDPDSPQTAVSPVFWPAVIGIVLFAGVAVFSVKKLSKRSEI